MHIAHVNDVANVGTTLVKALVRQSHAAELVRLRLPAARCSTAAKVLVLPLRLKEVLSANRYIRKRCFDVVHIHYAYLGWMGIIGRYPYVLHCHGTDVRVGLKNKLRRPIVSASLKSAAAVLYSTPDLKSVLDEYRRDAVYLPNPINTDVFAPHPRSENAWPPKKILLISRLNPVKRPEIAFEVVEKVRRRHPETIFTAVNDGSDSDMYRQREDVDFISPVPYERMSGLINEHDIVIGQFGIGSLGMSELESMACARPVIAYVDMSLYDDSPPVLAAGEADRASEHVCRLLEDRDYYEDYCRRSRAWVVKHHHYLEITSSLLNIYSRVAHGTG